jgi:3-hydroxyisobutyrate dehydrogenase
MKIGIAGTGRMGAAMAGRLAGLGHEVSVWNRSAEKARALGLKAATSPAALVDGSQTVISMLADAAALQAVYPQLLSGDAAGKLFIDMSTVRPQVSKQLLTMVEKKGAAFIECPVGGTVGPAKEGRLFGFAGGDAQDIARAKPLLEQLCRRVEHVGPVGAGASMKLAINLPLMVYWQALGEALSLCQTLGLSPARLMDIFSDTSGAPAMLKNRAPAIAEALAGRPGGTVTVDIDTMKKDLSEMVEEARSLGWPAPVTEAALQCFARASRQGLGDRDCVMLPVDWSSKPQKL